METEGGNKSSVALGTSPATNTEQGHGETNNSHLENHPSSIDSVGPSSESHKFSTNNDPNKTPGSACDNVSTNVESNNSLQVTEQRHHGMTNKSNLDNNAPPDLGLDSHVVAEFSDMVDAGRNQGSEVQNPPTQVMERLDESGTPSRYVFPSHVFARNNTNAPVDWSAASNESLFSICMGNMSFSIHELVCFNSCELDKLGDVYIADQPNASPSHQPQTPVNKFNDIAAEIHGESLKVNQAKAVEIMREVILESSMTIANDGNLDKKDSSSHRQSDGSTISYAFKSSSRRSIKEKQDAHKQAEEKETPNAIDEAPNTKAPSNTNSRHYPLTTKSHFHSFTLTLLLSLLLLSPQSQFHIPMATKSVTPNAIPTILANPSPDSSSDLPDIVVQVIDLKPSGNRYMFSASDGNLKLRAMLPSDQGSEVLSGNIQNLGLIRILDYTLNDIPTKSEKYLIVTKCEPVSPALEKEIKSEEPGIFLKSKKEGGTKNDSASGLLLKPKQEVVAKSAAQIVHEQHRNSAPSARMAMTRRVRPLVSLNPYQGNWTIKVSVTNKGNMRTYKNARGEGCVFNVELTDEDGTQIQATMFNDAARKFFDKFVLGKVYYISKGTLKVANKQFKTVQNDYEMTLNENSEVEEVAGEASFVPEVKFNFVSIDQLGPHVNKNELVDVVGVVKNVSSTMSIRRKSDNEAIPKRDITIADESRKTVVVSLWNDLANNMGQELLDIADQSPVVAIKSLKVGDFQGVSLSTISRSVLMINPDLPEAKKLRCWYDDEGKDAAMDSVGSGSSPMSNNGVRSVYIDRVSLSHITSNPSLGDGKPAFFSIRGYINSIKPDQAMWYRACKTCNKKVTEGIGSGYWCEGCQKNDEQCSLRYIMVVRVVDASGEAYISVFNEQAEKVVGCSADELDDLKSQEGEDNPYQLKLKEATWVPHLFRVSVAQNEYNNEKRQRITARAVVPLDFAAESRILLEEISKMRAH
ncbi:hypothetical protein RJT34_33491 [Clitoria ternatea]|uniref:Replication protein A subunit n=1 Tax=Clitoria ternatea TaxID=43366 RepID=A0AAN9I4N7_CLITE